MGALEVFIVFMLHLVQQYIVLPLTLTARVFTLFFLAVMGIDIPIFLQAGHVTPAVFLAAGAAEAKPKMPMLKPQIANVASFLIIRLLKNTIVYAFNA